MFGRRYPFYITNPKHYLLSSHTQPKPHSHTTNTLIKEQVQNGHFVKALELYISLWNQGFKPDNFTFPYLLKASSQLNDPNMGFLLHNHAITTGFESNLFVANSLILLYGRFGHLESIHYLFNKIPQRNIVTWTAFISACTQNHQFNHAIQLFHGMLMEGTKPNSFTMATLLPSFSYSQGSTQIHSFLIKYGFLSDIFVSTALIDAYAKCGTTLSARRVFEEMQERNLVSWNAMISGYTQNGNARGAIKLFVEMQKSTGIQPDSFSVVTILCSCSSIASLRQGKEIHGYVYKASLEKGLLVGNGLIDMYGKCGALDLAAQVFDRMQERDVGSWTALITCYGLHGQGNKAIILFETMKQTTDVKANSVTITAVLSACSHSCLVEEGFRYFRTMSAEFGIEPIIKHYVCMVDMLARAGLIGEALEFINKMPVQADVRVWEALLGAATIQGDIAAAEMAAKRLIELDSENPDLHVQLVRTYANAGRWNEVAKMRERMRCKRVGKSSGVSWIHDVQ